MGPTLQKQSLSALLFINFPCIQYAQCTWYTAYISLSLYMYGYTMVWYEFHIFNTMSETIFKSLPDLASLCYTPGINWIISSPGKCTLWLTFTVFSGPDLGTGAEVPTVGVGAGPTMFTRRIQALIGVYKQRNNKMASYITCTLKKFINNILVFFYLTTKSWYIRKRGQCKEPERHIRYIKTCHLLNQGL